MNYAEEIKRSVTMRQAADRYGLEVNRSGFACCPFHGEKTPSFKVYPDARGFYCFGCGASGDVIDFVRKLYGLSFRDAIARINGDFSLGLPLGEKISQKKRLESERRKFIAEKKEREKQAVKFAYDDALKRFIAADNRVMNLQPPDPAFFEALKEKERASYELECAENERYTNEHGTCTNP